MPITVHLARWPASTQVQAVICGQLGIGGSNSCYQPGAALGRIASGGGAVLQLKVQAPPKPCPCVIRVRSFSGSALALDLPFDVVGHKRAKLPAARPAPTAAVTVTDVRVENEVGLRSLFGVGGPATVIATVTNEGDAEGPAPALEYGVGEEGELTESLTPDLVVPARQSREVEIEVSLPLGAMGTHHARVRAADSSEATRTVAWSTYPWGWLPLLAFMGALIGFVVWVRRRSERTTEAAGGAHRAPAYPLPDVVWVEELGALLVNPETVRHSRLLSRVEGRLSVADLNRIPGAASEDLDDDVEEWLPWDHSVDNEVRLT